MKIISWNVNGLRSALKDNFLKSFKNTSADFFCLQEIKAQPDQLPEKIVNMAGYSSYFNTATKKGYAGVAIYSKFKKKPISIQKKIGLKRFDDEGIYLQLEYSNFVLINLYLPHGGRQKENLNYKIQVYKKIINILERIKNKKIILVGDFNIAHKEIDLESPKNNKNNIMFTPKERRQIDNIIKLGFIDTFRHYHTEGGNYTWWPYMANARKRNLGWRIDYIFVSQKLKSKLKRAFILNKIMGSDHCPIGIEIKK